MFQRALPSLALLQGLTPFFILLAFSLMGCQEESSKTPVKPAPMPAQTITVQHEKIPIWTTFTGFTKASGAIEVRARVAGKLLKRYINDGDHVNAGDKLFLIDPSEYKAKLNRALADKKRHQAALKLAKTDVERYKPLVKDGLAPRATLESYEAQYSELKAQIEADDAAIEKLRIELGYTLVTAPADGYVSARRVDVGNLVGYGESTLLTTIKNANIIYAYFAPSERMMQIISHYKSKPRLDAFIEVRAGSGETLLENRKLFGYVDFSDNAVDPQTSTIAMRATINNGGLTVYPGTFVYVHMFVTDQIPILMVPPQIIFEDQLGHYLYVSEDNKAKKKYVKVGYSSRYYTQIKEGLKDGEQVIINGLVKLQDGKPISPVDMTPTKGMMAVVKEKQLIPDFNRTK